MSSYTNDDYKITKFCTYDQISKEEILQQKPCHRRSTSDIILFSNAFGKFAENLHEILDLYRNFIMETSPQSGNILNQCWQ